MRESLALQLCISLSFVVLWLITSLSIGIGEPGVDFDLVSATPLGEGLGVILVLGGVETEEEAVVGWLGVAGSERGRTALGVLETEDDDDVGCCGVAGGEVT